MTKLYRLRRKWLTRPVAFGGEYLLEAVGRQVHSGTVSRIYEQLRDTHSTMRLYHLDKLDASRGTDVRAYVQLASWDSVRWRMHAAA